MFDSIFLFDFFYLYIDFEECVFERVQQRWSHFSGLTVNQPCRWNQR